MPIIKSMKTIQRIGVTLTQGCTLPGGESAMDTLAARIPFNHRLSIQESLLKTEKPQYLSAIVDLNVRLKHLVSTCIKNNEFPLVFGGDHALAIGSIAGVVQDHDHAVLWIDAHGDCNTDVSSISQRIHGMPLAVVQGQGHPDLVAINDHVIQAQNILLIGIRSLDLEEEILMKQWGNRYITMSTIEENGLEWLQSELRVFMQAHAKIHVSFDCDSMDPALISGVNTPVKGGFNVHQILPILSTVLSYDAVTSMDIVEFNPSHDDGSTFDLIHTIHKLVSQAKEG